MPRRRRPKGGTTAIVSPQPAPETRDLEDLSLDLPPRLPETMPEVDRAIMLLGCRAKTDLRGRAQRELAALIGVYPNTREANRWKRTLKTYREELARDLGTDIET